jgi:hypothetical protein
VSFYDADIHMLNILQSPPAAAPAGEAAHYPPALPTDEPSMVARAQDILVLLSGPQMQLESTRVRPVLGLTVGCLARDCPDKRWWAVQQRVSS